MDQNELTYGKSDPAYTKKELFARAIRDSSPVFFGFIFLGISFGILMHQTGFSAIETLLSSVFIYAGSMQFALVGFLRAGIPLLTICVMTLLINSRHLFYGLSFLEDFKQMGPKGLYMIYSLTDETFSLLVALKDVSMSQKDKRQLWFYISVLNHAYWVVGGLIGAVIGTALPFDMTGIDFTMTALFVIILLEQLLANPKQNTRPAILAAAVSVCMILLFGIDRFLLPALAFTVFALALDTIYKAKRPAGGVK